MLKVENPNQELSEQQLDGIAGGLNPQPLPPRIHNFDYSFAPIAILAGRIQ